MDFGAGRIGKGIGNSKAGCWKDGRNDRAQAMDE